MADISKCVGAGCHLKNKCYRFTAKLAARLKDQSFIKPERVGRDCEWFWNIEVKKTGNTLGRTVVNER